MNRSIKVNGINFILEKFGDGNEFVLKLEKHRGMFNVPHITFHVN